MFNYVIIDRVTNHRWYGKLVKQIKKNKIKNLMRDFIDFIKYIVKDRNE